MIEIIKNTSNIINDKIEIKEEINTLLASKKFEQKVLTAMPILMIVLLSVSAEDYMAPVFDKIVGRIVMTIAIAIIVLGYFLSKKIMNIKV
jgi:tight adherence protein B